MKFFTLQRLAIFTCGCLVFSYLLSFGSSEKSEAFPLKVLIPYSHLINDEHKVLLTKEMTPDSINEIEIQAGSYDVEIVSSPNSLLKLELNGNLSNVIQSFDPLVKLSQNGKVLQVSIEAGEGKGEPQTGIFWSKKGWEMHFHSGGNLTVWLPKSLKKVGLKTISGDVSSKVVALDSQTITTVSGDVHIKGDSLGDLSLKTVSGTVDIDTKYINLVDAKTVSGDLNVSSQTEPNTISFQSTSGDLNLELEETSQAKINFKSVSGTVSILEGERESSFESNSFQHILGSGAHSLQMKSVSGDLNLTTVL